VPNVFDQFREALAEAERVERAASDNADRMAAFLTKPGTLRRVSPYELRKLKRELRLFDMTSGKWRAPR